MKKKFLSICLTLIMSATVFVIPVSSEVYGTTIEETDMQASGNGELQNDTDIGDSEVMLDVWEYVYTGNAVKPVPKVKHNGKILDGNTDYTLAYKNNVKAGTAKLIVTGTGEYIGTKSVDFNIIPAEISSAQIQFNNNILDYNYTGKARIPYLTVKLNGKTLKKDEDYVLKCKNNIYPGTATVEITGIKNYKSSVSKNFYIAMVNGLKVKTTGTDSITLNWSKESGVSGYVVFKYSFSKKKWNAVKTIYGNSTVTYKDTNVKAGYGYQYRVKSFVKVGSKPYYGQPSKTLNAPARPEKVKLTKLSTNVRLDITAYWKKKISTGYQVKISRKSDFSNSITYTVRSASSLSKTINVSKDNTVYYVKVRAYRTYGGKTVYGSWSDSRKIRTDGTGWATFSGKKYYYRGGNPVKGSSTINGNMYYFNKNNGELLGASYTMWSKIKNQSSGTKWLIAVSRDLNRTCVYYRQDGKWTLKYYWKCATGADATRTPAGIFTVPKDKTYLRYFGNSKGYTCWYATRFYKRCYFHSVLYYPASQVNILDGRLGANLSHGCVRLAKDNALWIYNNIKAGTKVVIY